MAKHHRLQRYSWVFITFLALMLLTFLSVARVEAAVSHLSWDEWVKQLRVQALAEGVNPQIFDMVFADIHEPNRRVLHFDRTQPERRITFLKYRSTRIDPYRIKLGQMEYRKNQQLLDQIGRDYGVDPCVVTAIWGLETSYGRFMGDFPVIKSLATLAYDDRRATYFRKELLFALHILSEGHVQNSHFKGEWAGASGHPQFMPSSWHKYAVDYNKDGRRDIWDTPSDVFASVANYLATNGWQKNQPWAVPVNLPSNFPSDLAGLTLTKSVQEWERLGVKAASGFQLPTESLQASIVRPDGGPDFMTFRNFKVIMTYNNSIFYAGSLGYLADKICKRQ